MDTMQRIDRIAMHLAESFSSVGSSVSVEDEVADGELLVTEIDRVLSDPKAGSACVGAADLVEALDTIRNVWSSGYDLASGDDYVTDDATVSDIVCEYVDSLEEGSDPAP